MNYYYSASTNAFYPLEMKQDYEAANSWPDDAKKITEKRYYLLMQGQSNGKVIGPDKYGEPVLTDPAPPSQEQLIYEADAKKALLMQEVNDAIAPLQDAVEFKTATDDEISRLNAWRKYRILLNRVDCSNAPDISWPEVPGDVA